MEAKNDFNTPEDLTHEEAYEEHPEAAGLKAAVGPGLLMGTWVNANAQTRGLVKINVQWAATGTTIQAWGACTPQPCNWGRVPCTIYAPDVSSKKAVALSASFPASFKDTILVGYFERGLLVLETYNRFKDGSSRSDYFMRDFFRRG